MSARRLGFGGQVRAVWRKELTDALRDRRSLMSALIVPLIMPLKKQLDVLARINEGNEIVWKRSRRNRGEGSLIENRSGERLKAASARLGMIA